MTKELKEKIEALGVVVNHHFGGGVGVKEIRIPAGVFFKQHSHDYEHLSYLAAGEARVDFEDRFDVHTAPAWITIPAGHSHRVTAIRDATWVCLHATDKLDPGAADAEIMQGGRPCRSLT